MQLELFDDTDCYDEAYKNPMVRLYGKGPDGKKCKTCDWLYYREWGKRYYKCGKRGDTRGPGTDHRIGYAACRWYIERK